MSQVSLRQVLSAVSLSIAILGMGYGLYRVTTDFVPPRIADAALITTNWTGAGDGSSWSDAANWDNGVPDANKDAVIDLNGGASVTAAGSVIFDNLTLGGTAAATNTLLLTGTITGTNITIDAKGDFTQSNSSTQTITGTLTVKSGGVLTHSANTTAHDYSVNFAANAIDIQAGGGVNVDGRGYRGGNGAWDWNGSGPGAGEGNNGGGASGGAHAGNGAGGNSHPNQTAGYCTVQNVNTLGSGGGSDGDPGGNGGGLIVLHATTTLTISGSVSANGRAQGDTDTVSSWSGGGAGGGVNIFADTIIDGGSASISVRGGAGAGIKGGGGGGGCATMIYGTANALSPLVIGVDGGAGLNRGGTGLVYVKKVGSEADLYEIGNGYAGARTTQGDTAMSVKTLTVSSSAAYSLPAGRSLTITDSNPLLGDGTGSLTASGTFALSATSTITNVAVVIGSGGVYTNLAASPLAIGSSGRLTLGSGSTLTNAINAVTVEAGGALTLGPQATITGPIASIYATGSLDLYADSVNSAIAASADVIIAGATTTLYGYSTTTGLVIGTLTIKSGSVLTHGTNSTSQTNVINIQANSADIQSGAVIDVDGRGYRGGIWGDWNGQGPGAGQGNNAGGASGGAHGGNGGGGNSYPNETIGYCNATNPQTIGSGGGNDNGTDGGGAGGGFVQLVINGGLQLNGSILARGYSSADGFTVKGWSGGGAGGGVNITANTISGTPEAFNLTGGTGGVNAGGGGGGCVAIRYTTSNSINPLTTVSALGGGGRQTGGAGEVYIEHVGGVSDLYVVGQGVASAKTTQGESSVSVDTMTVSSRATYLVPEGRSLTLTNVDPLLGSGGFLTASGTLALSATSTIANVGVTISYGGTYTNLASSPLSVASTGSLVLGLGAILANPVSVIQVDNGGSMTLGPSATMSGSIASVYATGTLNLYADTIRARFSPAADVIIAGATTTLYGFSTTTALTIGNLVVKDSATLTHGANTTTQQNTLNINADTVDIQLGGAVNVDGKGYRGGINGNTTGIYRDWSGYGPGGGQGSNSGGASGGAHGGNGGGGNSYPDQTIAYCDASNPLTMGSGGGNDNGDDGGGAGGGLVQFAVTSTFTLNGSILARGYSSAGGFTVRGWSGGGAGGGVNVRANTFLGTPEAFNANGGTGGGNSGGGGGGCVRIVYASSLDAAVSSTVSVLGGTAGREAGGVGTFIASPTNSGPSVTLIYPTQSTASLVSVTSTIADSDSDTTSLHVEYSTDNATWNDATLASVSQNGEAGASVDGVTTSTGHIAGIDTQNDGSVNLTFTWNAAVDLLNTEDATVYLRITPNDGTVDGSTEVSSAFALDTKAPTAPGDLAISSTSTHGVTVAVGSQSVDQSFREYVFHYKLGSSGVSVSDSSYTSSTNVNLGSISYGGQSTVTLANLFATGTQYVVNIWAEDAFNRVTPAATEISFYTLADIPGSPSVAALSTTSLSVVINKATNPSLHVTYAICTTANGTSCEASGYVQADGSLAATPIWQTYAAWGGASGIAVTGLTPSTGYQFLVQAKNGDGVTTSLSSANTAVLTNSPASTNTDTNQNVGNGALGAPGIGSLPPVIPVFQVYDSVTKTYLGQNPPSVLTLPPFVPPVEPSVQNPAQESAKPLQILKVKFVRTLSLGTVGNDVKNLQVFLNAQGFLIAKSGPGSKGKETTKFGVATKQALIKFQKAHLKELFGVKGKPAQANGVFGPATLKYVNSLVGK